MAREKLSDKVKRLEAIIEEKQEQLELAIQVIDEQADKVAQKSFYQPFFWGVLASSALWAAFLLLS